MTTADRLGSLLAAGLDGDEIAMFELVRCTQPMVWRFCLNMGSPGEVDDLVQETYLRALRSAGSFRGEARVSSWLLSIARNVCADHVRRRTRQARLMARVLPARSDAVLPQSDGAVVDDLVRRLDRDRREAFVLTQLSGLSYADAAEVLGCPIGTIRSRVARARADLLTAVRQAEAL